MAHIRTGRSGEEEASPPPVQSATTRLRGLPYSATEEDLIGFFEDFDIKSTHICKRSGAQRPRLFCAACPGLALALWLMPDSTCGARRRALSVRRARERRGICAICFRGGGGAGAQDEEPPAHGPALY